jgi:hypothetical protein
MERREGSGVAQRERHPLEDPETFSMAASLRSLELLRRLLDEEQFDDLFEHGFAIESTNKPSLVLDLLGCGVLALEDGRLVQFCVDPDIEVPRLDRLATKLLWARGDWPAFRSEAVPLLRIGEEEIHARIAESGSKATWLRTHYRAIGFLSRLMSAKQMEDLGAGRTAFTRGPFILFLGENPVAMLDTHDGVWWRLEFPSSDTEPRSNYWLRHVIASNDPFSYLRWATRRRWL